MKHITDEQLERLFEVLPGFTTAEHLSIIAGNLEEAQAFKNDRRVMASILNAIRVEG